jgi:hypothetical protein
MQFIAIKQHHITLKPIHAIKEQQQHKSEKIVVIRGMDSVN